MPRKSKNFEDKKANKEEIEKIVLNLAGQGLTSEKIGLELKKKGIYAKALGTKIGKILKNNNLYIDADIKNLEKKIEKMKKHLSKNKHDYSVIRALSIKEAKLNKLKRLK